MPMKMKVISKMRIVIVQTIPKTSVLTDTPTLSIDYLTIINCISSKA
jgi:hypothetical protein